MNARERHAEDNGVRIDLELAPLDLGLQCDEAGNERQPPSANRMWAE